MAFAHLPSIPVGWMAISSGLALIAANVRGVDAPRAWIEWVERRFAYGIRMRFAGGVQMALAGGALWFLREYSGLAVTLASIAFTFLLLVGLGMIGAQNLSRHMVISLAEQNDLAVRIVAGAFALYGLALVVLPFVL